MPPLHEIAEGAHVVGICAMGKTGLAFALADGRIVLNDAQTTTVMAHGSGLLAASNVAGDRFIYSGGADGRAVRSDLSGNMVCLHEEPRKWLDRIAVGAGGAMALAVGREALLVRGKDPVKRFQHDRSVNGLSFAPKGFRLATAHAGGASLWWAARDVEPTVMSWDGAHLDIVFSPDGRFLVTSMQDNQLHGWHLTDNRDMRMSGYPAKTRSWSWSVKGHWLATSGADAAVLWPFRGKDGPMGQQPKQLGARESRVTFVACHPQAPMVAIGYADGMVQAAQIEGTGLVALRQPDNQPVSALAFSQSGDRLGIGTEQGFAGISLLTEQA